MKRRTSVGLVGLSVFAGLLLAHSFSNERLVADGAPAPPWPKLDNALVADGAPAPPWPKIDDSLVADGAPAPPWPKLDDSLVADGAPAPPWPKGFEDSVPRKG